MMVKAASSDEVTNNEPTKPICPPFTFRDPEDSKKIYGSVHSVKQLAEILNLIPYFSIEYHSYRVHEDNTVTSDLSLWIKYVLGLNRLADEVEQLGQQFQGLELKERLIELINAHMFDI